MKFREKRKQFIISLKFRAHLIRAAQIIRAGKKDSHFCLVYGKVYYYLLVYLLVYLCDNSSDRS